MTIYYTIIKKKKRRNNILLIIYYKEKSAKIIGEMRREAELKRSFEEFIISRS